MISYCTLMATRLLHALHNSGERPLAIAELTQKMGIARPAQKMRVFDAAYVAGRVIRHLKEKGWVECDYRYRYTLAVDLYEKSLFDLVLDIDKEIHLGSSASAGLWDIGSCDGLPRLKAVSVRLRSDLICKLGGINLGELVTGHPADKIYASAETPTR